jgi:hypothetical protein
MKITICGSLQFIAQMMDVKSKLEQKGYTVLVPLSAEINQSKDWWNKLKSEDIMKFASSKGERMMGHFDKIKSSDAVLVLNYDKEEKKNYIGANTLMEMAVAFENNKKIFILNELAEGSNYEEIISMSPIILNGNLESI